MRILFIGDIIGRSGRAVLKKQLLKLKKNKHYDIVIANGENSASGFGITDRVYKELLSSGVDIITGGNHTWDRAETFACIPSWDRFVRPLNYPAGTPGVGYRVIEVSGVRVMVINLLGRIFMNPIDDPFRHFDEVYDANKDCDIVLVDLHAEATSEKNAFGLYTDGRATAVFGTHTHVQTNDMRLLPNGTVYITDAGMCGSLDSVIGMDRMISVSKFTTGIGRKFEVEKTGRMVFNAVSFDVDENRCATNLEYINLVDETIDI